MKKNAQTTKTTTTKTITLDERINAAFSSFRNKTNNAQNAVYMAIGTLKVEHAGDTVSYGFIDLDMHVPRETAARRLTADDEDKFMVTAADFETAKAEFWGRWRIFTRQAFGINFVRIEMRGQPIIIRDGIPANADFQNDANGTTVRATDRLTS